MEDAEGSQHCPSCDSTNVRGVMVTDKFPYGTGSTPVELSAEVLMFNCYECGAQYTGEQGERAREQAVQDYWLKLYPKMLLALKAQHEAIDRLFALLIAKTMHSEHPFYPSESGQPWEAIQQGRAMLDAAGVSLYSNVGEAHGEAEEA